LPVIRYNDSGFLEEGRSLHDMATKKTAAGKGLLKKLSGGDPSGGDAPLGDLKGGGGPKGGGKSVPFLQQHFARPLKVCYMKGRNNYACRQKIYDAEKSPVLTGLEEV